MHKISSAAAMLALSAFMAGCAPAPECKVASGTTLHGEANAGCLVVVDDQLLTVRQRQTGRLNTPGGSSQTGESAQCTAHRETWEETGLTVTVGRRLKVFDNGFHLYLCQPAGDSSLTKQTQVPGFWGRREISEVLWLNPHDIRPQDWRYPQQINDILTLMESLNP